MSKEFYIDSVYVKRKHVKSSLHLEATWICVCIAGRFLVNVKAL